MALVLILSQLPMASVRVEFEAFASDWVQRSDGTGGNSLPTTHGICQGGFEASALGRAWGYETISARGKSKYSTT